MLSQLAIDPLRISTDEPIRRGMFCVRGDRKLGVSNNRVVSTSTSNISFVYVRFRAWFQFSEPLVINLPRSDALFSSRSLEGLRSWARSVRRLLHCSTCL